MDDIHDSDWNIYKFGETLPKSKDASYSYSNSENVISAVNKINNFETIIDVSSRVRNKVLSDITPWILNANNGLISQKCQRSNFENTLSNNQKTYEEKFSVCDEAQTSGVSSNILSDVVNIDSSSSSFSSDRSSSFSEDDTLLQLISQGSFSIDPQKITTHETDLFLNTKYGLSNYKLPCNSNLTKNSQNVKRKLKFSSKLKTKFKKDKTSKPKLSKIRNQAHDKDSNSQSFISDYFNITKFSQNENFALSNFEEPIKIEKFDHFDDNINLISTIDEGTSKNATLFESEHSSIFNLDNSQSKLTDSEKKISRKMLKISKMASLIYTGPKVVFDDQIKKTKSLQITTKIEEVLLNFISSLKEVHEYNNSSHSEIMQNDKRICKPRLTIGYDNKDRQRFSSIKIFLLGKIYSLICRNDHCSQRQVYYELKKYVSNQSIIANTLFSICLLLNVEPWYLPITSSGTGLVYGNLKIITSNNIIINCLNFGGTLIPQDVLQIKEFQSDATFILVVEKDAIFKKLLDEDICKSFATSCIVITGKGFPDYNTRLFSKLLWRHLRIPIFILTDGDPYGIEIMLTYRFGSVLKPHFLEDIAIPEMQWIGILPSDIETLSIPHEDLNQADIAKVQKMMKRPYVKKYDWLQRELTCMLKCGKKAGIEGVLDNYGSLTKFYLVSKFFSTDFY